MTSGARDRILERARDDDNDEPSGDWLIKECILANHLEGSFEYERNNLSPPDEIGDRTPRRYSVIRNFLFEDPDSEKTSIALDLIFDIISAAKKYDSRLPELPLRMHLFKFHIIIYNIF